MIAAASYQLYRKGSFGRCYPNPCSCYHCKSSVLVNQCVDRVARSDLDSISLEKDLPYEVAESIKLLRLKSQPDDECNTVPVDPVHEKDLCLHYAAAYCDPKVVSEVLSLGLADVNRHNPRGYTVLHVAAMRKEPSIIVSLLTKGAHASERTSDGQSAVSICRRLTRPKDYHAKMEQGQETNKDRICIDVLEREMRRNPLAGDVSISSPTMADDLQ
ncbi:BTB/POZ domain and ankyrin repeat-containing protein NPR2 [Vitis vinifera]|uniref:BTB/POZ domain and ankyrin repeat-containing protein NPR2 n=1 Tax=Vitis vinifera TaxID=29760 RepID=A0A438HBN5_VITVI|nr:BTB/POZ domain and ankyrin repeat-containing protein NPR2 [Vitis vinifera]